MEPNSKKGRSSFSKQKNDSLNYAKKSNDNSASETPVTSKEYEKISFKVIKTIYKSLCDNYSKFNKNIKLLAKMELNSRNKKLILNNNIMYIDEQCKNLGSNFPEYFKKNEEGDLAKLIDIRSFTEKVQNLYGSFNKLIPDYKSQKDEFDNDYKSICKSSKMPKIFSRDRDRLLKEYRTEKEVFMKKCKIFIPELVEVNKKLGENVVNFDVQVSEVANNIQDACNKAIAFLKSKKNNELQLKKYKNNELQLKKYKKNFATWYAKKVTDNELKKYKGFLGNIVLRKSNPKKLIDKVDACKSMTEFEKLIGTLGMNRNDLKNKKIFGDAVK